MSRCSLWHQLCLFISLLALPAAAAAQEEAPPQPCFRTLVADVVAFDQVFFFNRLGAMAPQGMVYALRRDVVPISGTTLSPGNVRLRSGKRPRPLVLRMNVDDCLEVRFQNLLAPTRKDNEQPATRWASMHAVGLELANSIADDGSFVGTNASSLADVGQSRIYTWHAEREGEHVLISAGATNGGQGDGGSLNSGLFGAVIVEPAGSRWYRSQLTREELDLANTNADKSDGAYPIVNYEARYPAGYFPSGDPRTGQPILNMLDGNQIVHSDLTAIIAGSLSGGSQAGWFAADAFPSNVNVYPERSQPFREFVTIYHDEIGAVQAFPEFEKNPLKHTLQGGRDGFAINYGSGGIGAEVLASRIGVGPMRDCTECKFEEFFLTSWVVGDPAMVVDVPANHPCTVAQLQDPVATGGCTPTANVAKATKAFYPDDPSNVYHSYLNDHTRFRVLHAGSKEHHIHHLHAHQWLFNPDSDDSSYLDSQALGPGSSFTAEIAYQGSGNRNKTVGDSIFHCHFYPHFAQGMWALWRVHDVFEKGSTLNDSGRPTSTTRALPDGEIVKGTPIPAVVPLPGKAMAPLPGATVTILNGQVQIAGSGNPGFPFFVPGRAGHRPPKPPLDTIDDGGLPRHIITGGTPPSVEEHTRLSWHKKLDKVTAQKLDEQGTLEEKSAMAFHEQPSHATCFPNGTCSGASFLTNGRPRVKGAPFADPCPADATSENQRFLTYKAADIQDDVKINKKGWHFPQQRFSALWEDVDDFLGFSGGTKKPPEPLFFRANSRQCIEFHFTNLVPQEYALDDFQVRTPTDILGQHIHLVKFDVLASDGAANGFNYEDGSFAPAEVRERIDAIRAQNGCVPGDPRQTSNPFACPVAKLHPFAPFQREEWRGAQTTVQRWYADPTQNNQGEDRTLRTVFTHDHFGPSTHQQAGLYAGLVIEPEGSTWQHNETGNPFYTRSDGGPTSWQAVITPPAEDAYREFLLAFGDFQPAYEAEATTFPDRARAINPPFRIEVPLTDGNDLVLKRPQCPGGGAPPCPEIVSADDTGTMAVNYRNEPIALRVRDPLTNSQASGNAGDLSFAFASITRQDANLNSQPAFYTPLTNGVRDLDPFTPLLRAYENDRVQIRILVGAHEEGHNFSVHGIKWLFEPSDVNSGYRNSQMMGISEHFEFIVPQLIKNPTGGSVDRLWMAGSSTDDLWNGIWGLLRAYTGRKPDLEPLRENPNGSSGIDPGAIGAWDHSCPKDAPVRTFDVTAVTAQQALPNGELIYNSRTDGFLGPLSDPTAILYVRTGDLVPNTTTLAAGVPVEPLILRARAGECIKLTLRNKLPASLLELDGWNSLPMLIEGFNANDIKPSNKVGLHPQLLHYDVSRFDGTRVGGNANQTVDPGQSTTYEWYAGGVTINPDGTVTATPIEFGATNLISSDRIEHASKGAIGALIIEPVNATWVEDDPTTRAVARVDPDPSSSASHFREFVLVFQNDVNLRDGDQPVKNLARRGDGVADSEDSGQKAINYRTEPLWKRMQHAASKSLSQTKDLTDWYDVVSNSKVGGDPETPVFLARPGERIRLRLLQPGGHSRNLVFALHGHVWSRQPYLSSSTKLGFRKPAFWEGAHTGIGPTSHFDVMIRHGAGGAYWLPGDYLFRDQTSFGFDNGLWGILRVEPNSN